MTTVALFAATAVRGYQRWLSPHKGFSCPHRLLHGGRSCSGHALRIVERRGVLALRRLMRRRLVRCRAARLALVGQAEFNPNEPRYTRARHGTGWRGCGPAFGDLRSQACSPHYWLISCDVTRWDCGGCWPGS